MYYLIPRFIYYDTLKSLLVYAANRKYSAATGQTRKAFRVFFTKFRSLVSYMTRTLIVTVTFSFSIL